MNHYPVLIGLMGCGKSSIGRRLARTLNCALIDTDEEIISRVGMSIPEIFERHGEAYFRDVEHEVLRDALRRSAVVATGGGIVERLENRSALISHTPVVWLQAAPEFLAARIAGDRNRPLVARGNVLQTLRDLAAKRDPLYAECADIVMPRAELKKSAIVARILEQLSAFSEE